MKKVCILLTFALAAVFLLGGCTGSEKVLQVTVDGKPLNFPVDPFVEDGTVLVPGIEIFQALYGEPIWEEGSQSIGINDGQLIFVLQAGKGIANINSEAYELKTPPQMKGSHIMVPLDLVVAVLGYRLESGKTGPVIWTDVNKAEKSERERLLVGLWSSSQYFGEMYDPTGASKGSSYNGEWYLFRENGTFRFVIAGSGLVISGAVVQEGNYRVEGSELVLHSVKDSWYPAPDTADRRPGYENKPADDQRVSLSWIDVGTIKINEKLFYYHSE